MSYQPDERDVLVTRWFAAMPSTHTTGWEPDLDAYLTHERIKAAIVDSVRYSQLFAKGGPCPYVEQQLVASMTAKLNAARPYWSHPDRMDPAAVEPALNPR